MRIIAGEWRGRPLQAPAGQGTRPTADRTRETLFSMLVSRIGSFEGLRVADLYAGSGALGLEALSRGAAHVTFVENDRNALSAIRLNLASVKAADRADLRPLSAAKLAPAQPFDLILADPPYAAGSGSAVVTAVRDANWLADSGWLAIETEAKEPVDAGGWTIDAERRVGKARITLIRA
ncbi:16S rRNA (guanine(966)-N(2))-methyltransferase RsmD [Sphingomonas alba]|uniref:16S rRNA (Guanine(966)-N(2))-methyltransferase RsmD n=1 Tax=Sphingomonas alba TaxID=2908208 RepID=A0ABT0RPL0_9SPHN|nr:16S rRNA (guanine(966)-N(2))-methyltransferase RsmD [Sphingomonas alba]MCL6684586.1 16S rRNA (guanine(966)-N(2))-methyltransferase RsmD [Sphingomonas alba]